MRKAPLLVLLAVLVSIGCRAKPEPQKLPRARHDLYKPLPTPAAPQAAPGHPTPKRALPD
ncbi:MAG TPA: hypothetical protein VKG01_17840 [Thermoanaerobaculia bacterium]|nr:hypothetical protein [Thermoanaerobaculia bacterium]